MNPNRRTKTIWSFDEKTFDTGVVQQAPELEVDAIRLVCDPKGPDPLAKMLSKIDEVRSSGLAVSCILDIASFGRAHAAIESPRELVFGESVLLTRDCRTGSIGIRTEEAWQELFKDGETIYMGFGLAVLQAKKVSIDTVEAEVVQGGTIFPNMTTHVPGTKHPLPLTEISDRDLDVFLKPTVDYLVIPGVSDPDQLKRFRDRVLEKRPKSAPFLVLTIDSERVYQNLNELLPFCEGVLISRLEMALTMDPAIVPIVSKEIIQTSNNHQTMVFVASEMLASMRHNATPTRAEVSDIANAVFDGADGVVMSEEISHGDHALRALGIMSRTIMDAEAHSKREFNWRKFQPIIATEMDAVAFAAYRTAKRVDAKAIVCITEAGNTARSLASFRPPIPIIAVTFSEDVLRRLALVRGVTSLVLESAPTIDEVLPHVKDRLVRDSHLNAGDRIVFVSITISSLGRENSNLFTIQTLGE